MAAKRPRTLPLSQDDVDWYARLIMENDPFKDRAPRDEDRNFRALFGCKADIVVRLWGLLESNDLIPVGGTVTHLLWTLLHAKTYAKWKTMRKLTKSDPKTLRKWIGEFLDSIDQLEGLVILWENRKKGDIYNDCLTSVDCVDFPIPFAGRGFHTHKWKFGSGLRYEVAVCILSGDVVWVNGPFECGRWPDISIFRAGLLSMLEDGERCEADDGYIGAAPKYIRCPKCLSNPSIMASMQSLVRRRHETVNKRFKQWHSLKSVFRGHITKHGHYFRLAAIVTQLCIEGGEPLFKVDYEDPDFDNHYFDESDGEDSDGDEE